MTSREQTGPAAAADPPHAHTAAVAPPSPLTGRKSGRTLPGMFLPYQLAWINDAAPRKLGDKARRTGWTYAEAYDCTAVRYRRSGRREQDYWFSSADESAAAEFVEYCVFFARDLFGAAADRFTDHVEDDRSGRSATAFCLRTPSGHKIVAMSSNPRRFRSKGGDVCLDEFAFHDDARGMYTAAAPVTTWGGNLRIFSTPNGEGSEFNRLVQRARSACAACGGDPGRARGGVAWEVLSSAARELRLTPVFSYHRVTIIDAIEDGLVELINRTRGTTWTREAFLADCREKSLDEDAFRQEYLCTPSSDAAAWLPYALIERCEDAGCPAVDAPLAGYAGGPCYVGIDVGRKHDLTCAWVLEEVGDVLWTRRVLRLRDMPLPEQVTVIEGVLSAVRVAGVLGDQTGIGLGLVEQLQRRLGARVEGVTFTAAAKQALAVDLRGAMEDRAVRIPADDGGLRDALHRVRKVVTASGLVRFDAPRDESGHADEFWSLALAVHAARSVGGGLGGPSGVVVEPEAERELEWV